MHATHERHANVVTPPEMTAQTVTEERAFAAVPPRPRTGDRIYRRLVDRHDRARLRLAIDLVVLSFSSSMALLGFGALGATPGNRWIAAAFPLFVATAMRVRRTPDDRINASVLDTLAHVLGVVSLSVMLTLSVDAVLGGPNPLGLATRLWVFAVVYLGTARAVLVSARRHAIRTEAFATRTLVVGAGVIGSQLVRRLTDDPSYGLRPVGFLDSNPLPTTTIPALPVLGGPQDLASAVTATGADHVILAFSGEADRQLVQTVRDCEALGVGVSLVPRLYESINERTTLDHVGGLPLLTLHSIDPHGWEFAVKHLIDRSTATLALVVLSPALLVIALAVRLSSPGPILFRQRRVGRDGREFDVFKFRTMRLASSQPSVFELRDGMAPGGVEGQDRRTPIGRILRDLSLDELPQLINVVRGDMSLVGPRPERPEFAAQFARDVARYEDRHRVKSGITGWAQVHGLRGQTSIADRVEWDNYYIQNWSLRLDLRILFLTLAEMFRMRDSAAERQARESALSILSPVRRRARR